MRNITYWGCMILFGASSSVYAMAPINLFKPYDLNNTYKPYRGLTEYLDIAVTPEFGLHTVGRSAKELPCVNPKKGHEVNVLQIWDPTQDALAMLKGFPSTSEIGQLAQALDVDSEGNNRGIICFKGDLRVIANASMSARWYLSHHFIFGVYLPVTSLAMNINYTDLTQDPLTQQLLTNNLAENVVNLGGPSLCNWKNTGVGDVALILDWARNFPQAKELLKDVRTILRFGLSFPSAPSQNINDFMPIQLGNDGAFGLIFAGGLDLRIRSSFNVGVYAEFWHFFSNVRCRRFKTDPTQTELLLLAQGPVLKHFGFTELFNLYAEFYKLFNRVTLNFTYQFWHHDDDKLAIVNNAFSTEIANTARSLEEWTIHQIIYKISYDTEYEMEEYPVRPYFALFYKQPINGKNAILANTMGFIFSLSY